MAERSDPMGIMPSRSGPDMTGEAEAWPDVVDHGADGGARIVTIRSDDDLDRLGEGGEAWARFEAFDAELITEALVFGARAVVVPAGVEANVRHAFDPDAFLFEHKDTLRTIDGEAAYEREGDAWLRCAEDT